MKRSIRSATSSSVALLLVGCWTSKPADTPAKPPAESPGELAERTLRADAPFAVAYPSETPPRRHAASAALLAACRAGHHPSCWLLLHVATNEAALEVGLKDVIAECQQGDLWSCQAIPPLPRHPLVPADLAGWRGRLLAQTRGALEEEELAPLRTECRDGFAYSCKVLAERSPDLEERREMHVKTSVAARAACTRKVPDACTLVDKQWPADARLAALDWNCQVQRSECTRYAAALFEAGRLEEAHDEYERGCQYGGRPWLCLELVELYRDGTFKEPVPDRAATLLRVSCAELAGDDQYPECAPSP